MFVINNPLVILRLVVASTSTVICPFVKVPLMGRWNLLETDIMLFSVTIILLILLVLFLFFNKGKLFLIGGYSFLIWLILGISAVYFKINNFLGFNLLDKWLAKTLSLQWGWAILFVSSILIIKSVKRVKL